MIDKLTVFILGAGASVPYGYPTGNELRLNICNKFTQKIESLLIANSANLSDDEIKDTLEEARRLTDTFFKSSTPSIDLFLARNPIFSDIGKKAIVTSILECEKNSRFRERISDKAKDWYTYLFQKMIENLIDPKSYFDFSQNQVAFITFNYDRSLEHFFYESLINAFSTATEREIIDQINSISIYHAYGIVDTLPWQGGERRYRGNYSIDSINKFIKNITLIHEKKHVDQRNLVYLFKNAQRFFFLGFGYAEENLDFLDIRKYLLGKKMIYGTALGLTKKEIEEKRNILRKYFSITNHIHSNPEIYPLDCVALLREYL